MPLPNFSKSLHTRLNLIALLSGLVFAFGAQNAIAQTIGKYSIHNPQGDGYVAAHSVSSEQTRIVIYRDSTTQPNGVVSVYINDRYQASLQPNTFTVVCLPAAKHVLRARNADSDELSPTPRLPVVAFAGQSHYVRVVGRGIAEPQLDITTQSQAETNMSTARQQMHTISRVLGAKPCKENSSKPGQHVPEVITHATDLWFEDSNEHSKPVVDKKRIELDQLLDKLNSRQKHHMLHSVHIVGHGDQGLRSDKNENLAKARANTVYQQLLSQGVDADVITQEWRKQEPFDRRVEVTVVYESNTTK